MTPELFAEILDDAKAYDRLAEFGRRVDLQRRGHWPLPLVDDVEMHWLIGLVQRLAGRLAAATAAVGSSEVCDCEACRTSDDGPVHLPPNKRTQAAGRAEEDPTPAEVEAIHRDIYCGAYDLALKLTRGKVNVSEQAAVLAVIVHDRARRSALSSDQTGPTLIAGLERAYGIVQRHRRHVENSPGAGKARVDYALATIDDIFADLNRELDTDRAAQTEDR